MTKKLISWLSILTVFLTLLWSCHNEDFANSGIEPQRNNANFFKHKSSVTAKSGVDYVSILEAYNREKDFLSTMPDQKGMPIWDKMQVVDAENTTGLMIPLSYDNETMSSVLFATLNDENSISGVKDHDNKLLENIVYNSNIDQKFREQIFYTFMYMDNRTFGTEDFTNIPKDLFVQGKYDMERGRIKFKNFSTPTTGHTENNKMLSIEVCTGVWHCTHHGEGSCDYCLAQCYTLTCNTTVIWVGNNYPSASGTLGGGIPDGGGGGTPMEHTPDPCTQSGMSFYRVAPGCGGGSGNIEIPIDDPCEKTKNMLQDPVFQERIDSLYAKSKISGEKAFMVQNNGNIGPLIAGDEHSADLGNIAGNKGYYHNHTPAGIKMLSVPDIYKLFEFIVALPVGATADHAFGGMVATKPCAGCPNGYEYFNFLIRFNGTNQEGINIYSKNYNFDDLREKFGDLELSLKNKSGYSSPNGNFLSFKGLEEVFYDALDNMKIDKNKIILQRIDKSGKIYNVTLDSNGKPIETPCPEI